MTHHDTPECSHGTCGAERECTGPCKLRSLPVIDPKYLDEQLGQNNGKKITYVLRVPEGMSSHASSDLYAYDLVIDCKSSWLWWVKWASVAIGGGLLLALIIYTTSK